MSDTLPDVVVPFNDFTDAYTATGIAVGTSIQILNKGNYPVLVVESATKPTASSTEGYTIYANNSQTNPSIVKDTPTGVWLKTISSNISSRVNIQIFVE